jgi:hypothetical protein
MLEFIQTKTATKYKYPDIAEIAINKLPKIINIFGSDSGEDEILMHFVATV